MTAIDADRCAGCGGPLEPNRAPGRKRKWCSESCRKNTSYGGECVDCGAPTAYAGNRHIGTGASPRCRSCAYGARKVWTRETILAAIIRWADDRGGVPPNATDWNTTMAVAAGRPPRGREFPTVTAVIREFGTWNAAIREAGFVPNLPGRYGRDGEFPEVVAETVELYRSGLSLAECGERLGVSGSAVLARLAKVGEPRRSQNRWRNGARFEDREKRFR